MRATIPSVRVVCDWEGELPDGRPVQPVDWRPKLPPQFQGDGYYYDRGSIWGPDRPLYSKEEASLIYMGEIEVGEVKAVPIAELAWVRPADRERVAGVEVEP